jgi:hypothetical protein
MSQYPILQTRLYIAAIRVLLVLRTCLIERLNVDLGHNQGRPRSARNPFRCLRDDNSLSHRVGSWAKGSWGRRGLPRCRRSLDGHLIGVPQ